MNHFIASDFDIYSGTRGDVIDRMDGIWIELRDRDTAKWTGMLDDALKAVGYVRHP